METKANGHGGARAGAGRKKGGTNAGEHKDVRIVLCCTKDQAKELKEKAAATGKSVSAYIISLIFDDKKI